MGIEQIRMNQTKALPPASQFNWSQMDFSGKRVNQALGNILTVMIASRPCEQVTA